MLRLVCNPAYSANQMEALRCIIVLKDSGFHSIMELAKECNKLDAASKFLGGILQSCMINCVEGLDEVRMVM